MWTLIKRVGCRWINYWLLGNSKNWHGCRTFSVCPNRARAALLRFTPSSNKKHSCLLCSWLKLISMRSHHLTKTQGSFLWFAFSATSMVCSKWTCWPLKAGEITLKPARQIAIPEWYQSCRALHGMWARDKFLYPPLATISSCLNHISWVCNAVGFNYFNSKHKNNAAFN